MKLPILRPWRSSHSVADTIKQAGGVPKRDRVGHAFIKKTMAETKAVFGGELSGHLYFRDNWYADSAAIAFACLLSIVSRQDGPMSEVMEPFDAYAQSGDVVAWLTPAFLAESFTPVLWLGFALTEAIGIYALVIGLLLMFVQA